MALNIRVYSDLACPWCWVGNRRLAKALSQHQAPAHVEWRAYLLDPNFAPEGKPIDEYGERKFGPRFREMKQRIVESGRPDGAAFADWRWRANTRPGHMLVALARRHGKDSQAVEELFRSTYERGANIGDTQVLLGVAAKLGLEEEARQRLGAPRSSSAAAAALTAEALQGGAADDGASCGLGDGAACAAAPAAAAQQQQRGEEEEESVDGELLREVELDDATAKQRLHISGVPFFLISAEGGGQAYALSGAQPPEAFVEVFERALAEAQAS